MEDHYLNLGGRGLSSSIVAREVPPQCDPLGPENKLVIAAGLLAGTAVPNSGRISIGAKSPLTQGLKETSAGGAAAQKLARLGIQAIVLEGCANHLVSIKVFKGGVEFSAASELSLRGNTDWFKQYRGESDDGSCVISIGPAGEMGLKAAAIAISSPDCLPRIAARGGLGAVLGAKKVKALVIDDRDGEAVATKDPGLFKAAVKAYTQGITSHSLYEGSPRFGPPVLMGLINEMSPLATKNYSQDQRPVSRFLQRYFAAIDSLGLCLFAAIAHLEKSELTKHLIECVSLVLDDTLGEDYLLRLGAMVLCEEREFNTAAGVAAEDDRLPQFFSQEALALSGLIFDVPEAELDGVHE